MDRVFMEDEESIYVIFKKFLEVKNV